MSLEAPQRGIHRERLLRLLLEGQGSIKTPYELATTAEVTPQYGYKFVRQMEQLGLIQGLRVTDYGGFWRFWLSHHVPPVPREYRVRETNLRKFLTKKNAAPYALTTYVADQLAHHFLSPARWDLYIEPAQLNSWDARLRADADALLGPGNLRLLLHDPQLARLHRDIEGFKVVVDAQLVLDLLVEGGPAAEAAQLIQERRGWV